MQGHFLLNASRSGSTMMSAILRMHPEVLSLSEVLSTQGARALLPGRISGAAFWRQMARPSPMVRALANPAASPSEFLYHTRPGGRFPPDNCPPLLAVALPHLSDTPDALFDRLAGIVPGFPVQSRAAQYQALFAALAGPGQRVWVERSGGSLLASATLARAFPNARFIVLLRDGRDTALSMQAYKPARVLIWLWRRARRFGIDLLSPQAHLGRSRLIALTEPLAARILPLDRIMAQPPSLRDCAAFWSALTRTGLTQLSTQPAENRLVLRYEEMVRDPAPQLTRLAAFLNLSCPADWLSQASALPRARPSRMATLPAADLAELETATADARSLSDAFI